MMKTKYYFTFGTDKTHPFRGGWVEVMAESLNSAIELFNEHFPPTDGFVRCAFYYTESQFRKTGMLENGNFGYKCHLIIGEEC